MIAQTNENIAISSQTDVTQNLCFLIRQELIELAEPNYRTFHSNLLPGIDNILGVRVPKLRDIAKRITKANQTQNRWRIYLDTVQCEYYEETMIYGLIIGYAKMNDEERMQRLNTFVPMISNWAVCDYCCSTFKFIGKDCEKWFPYLLEQIENGTEFSIRFGVVSLLDYFINEEWIDRVLEIYQRIHHEGYYVKMAVAWGISMCYVKFPEKTKAFLETDTLDNFTHNKAIQKIRESLQVSKNEKEELNRLKRK